MNIQLNSLKQLTMQLIRQNQGKSEPAKQADSTLVSNPPEQPRSHISIDSEVRFAPNSITNMAAEINYYTDCIRQKELVDIEK